MRDPREYRVSSTSATSSNISDQVLGLDVDDSSRHTRKIARIQIVRRPSDEQNEVKLRICHQRRHSRNEPWEDTENFNLAHVRSGEEIQMRLRSSQTRTLYEILNDIVRISEQPEVYSGEHRYAVINLDENLVLGGRTRDVIRELLQTHGEDLWSVVQEIGLDLPEALALQRINRLRQEGLAEFESHFTSADWGEPQWHQFFRENTWIFGYGLSYQFLRDLQGEPNLGGQDIAGRGGQRGDFMMATAAETSFTVIVEIKRPDTRLVLDEQYRNGAHKLGSDLVGGVVQVQQQCFQWQEQSGLPQNREILEQQSIFTHEPKGILVIGNTNTLTDLNRRRTFESFRRRITKPEIVTFDELLERARFIAQPQEQQSDR